MEIIKNLLAFVKWIFSKNLDHLIGCGSLTLPKAVRFVACNFELVRRIHSLDITKQLTWHAAITNMAWSF